MAKSAANGNSARRELRGSVKRVRKGATRLHPETAETPIEVSVYVRRPPEAPPLKGMDHFISNPPGARDLISRQELNRRYAAKADDLSKVASFAAAHGLHVVETAPERRLVRLSGTAAKMAEAFGVKLFRYKTQHETYRGHEGPVTLPPEIADTVVGVFGLDNRRMARRAASARATAELVRRKPAPSRAPSARPADGTGDGFGGVGAITPPQVAKAYNFPSPTADAAGQTVAVLEFSGPLSNNIASCGFAQSDIDSFISFVNTTNGSNLQTINVVPVAIDQSSDNPGDVPGGSATNFNGNTDNDPEVALDLEVIVSLAQGAKVVAYFTPLTEQGWVDAINAIVADTANDPGVLSISWGWSELEAQNEIDDPTFTQNWPFEWTQAAYDQLTAAFQSAANIGMTVFCSSGDNGSDCGEDDGKAHVLYPSSDPWVTSCGGTIVNSLSPLSEGTWNDYGASGGGVSYLVGVQPWQASANVPVSANQDGHRGRGVPDVAGNASPLSGYTLWLYGQSSQTLTFTAPPALAGEPLGPVGGTSAVGPLYAALTALINASLDTHIGYLNPTLYALGGTSVFRDINDGVSNSVAIFGPTANSPGYTSGPGWDACTGWGSIDGSALLNALRPLFQRITTLILDRSTFGLDEVQAQGSTATFTAAVYVIADGFIPQQLGLNSGNLSSPPLSQILAFAGTFAALSAQGVALNFDAATGVQLQNPAEFTGPQRITFPFNIVFTSTQAFAGIPATPGYQDFTLTAAITTIGGGGIASVSATSSVAELELVLQADPYMSAGETWWLSDDMRVFTVTPATLAGQPPLANSSTEWPSDGSPNTYIANLLTELNTSFTDPTLTNTPFTGILPGEDQSALQLNTNDGSGNPVFNFGVARVHLQGDTAVNVRTFFRLFISPSPDTDFDTSTTFREAVQTDASGNPIPNTLIPLIGFPSTDMTATIPFFAAPRVDPTANLQTFQTDAANVQTMPSPLAPTPPTGSAVVSYFACYLDINQTAPAFPLNPTTEANANGPWPASSLSSINQIIMSNHACLVAEIAYAPDPIALGANAATSDKIQQRNLSWVGSDNPGALTSHRIPALFDLRPSTTVLPSRKQPPDELMIQWGNTPAGSTAAIYLPQADADEVLELADELYFTHMLRKQDAHTIACRTGSVTYVPIAPGGGQNFAGLLTVDLPSTVRAGQQFSIVVKRITSARSSPLVGREAQGPNWRYVVGAFQVNVPVSRAAALLPGEESLLAVVKWKLEHLPAGNRWRPVLRRYADQVSGRVDGFGGSAGSIPASPGGYTGIGTKGGAHPHGDLTLCGKVTGLIYDRFGDFSGFTMETEDGADERFRCEERAIEDVVRRAWLDRYVIEVTVRKSVPRVPVSIVMRRAPAQH